MTNPPSLEDLTNLVGRQLGIDHVASDHHLQTDLGAESADILNLALAIEDTWGLVISDEELGKSKTVGDLYTLFEKGFKPNGGS